MIKSGRFRWVRHVSCNWTAQDMHRLLVCKPHRMKPIRGSRKKYLQLRKSQNIRKEKIDYENSEFGSLIKHSFIQTNSLHFRIKYRHNNTCFCQLPIGSKVPDISPRKSFTEIWSYLLSKFQMNLMNLKQVKEKNLPIFLHVTIRSVVRSNFSSLYNNALSTAI